MQLIDDPHGARKEHAMNELFDRHYAWLLAQGYMQHETPLELLALVASEVGEAINECRHATPTDQFGAELADIVLRISAIARRYNIDLDAAVQAKITQNHARGNRGRLI